MSEKTCYLTIVRTVSGQEYNIAFLIKARIENRKLDIPSIIVIPNLKGFVFVETELQYLVQNLIYGLKHTKGIIRGKVLADEVLNILTKPVQVNVGDLVEIIAGPFRGFKAKVTDVDSESGTVRLEIIDASSPMPVTLSIREIRRIEQRG